MPLRSMLPVLLAFALLLPACTTLERTTDDDEPERPPPEEPAEPDEPRAEPREDEPEEEAPREPRTVQGYRIQILTTEDKEAADERAAEAETNWGQPVEVAWKAPFYRVRVGAFASRPAAQGTLDAIKQQYPDAFLVPDTVTIYPD